ncbi:MAG: hypothetical protein LBT18_05550 [Endomicrobium sp.]|jgi:predicted outer membrane repeat protein|nr:hypothetical protein [Endomicrobium sp.]
MKKILFLLLLFDVNVSAQVIDVSNFSSLDKLMSSDESQTISVVSSKAIVSSGKYHTIGLGTKIIYGNNNILDGQSHKPDSKGKYVRYSGFLIDSKKDVIIRNLTMQNFKDEAVYTSGKARLDLRGVVNFKNNSGCKNGGAIGASWGSSINFSGPSAIFKNNRVISNNVGMASGGAIYAYDASINFNGSDVIFTSNMAIGNNGNGGAVGVYDESTVMFGERVEFSNNIADFNGGAIYITHNSNVTIRGNVEFIGNNANANGGAIYMIGGMLNIETFNGMMSRFIGNKARGKSNAIHLANDALLNFNNNAINAVVDMNDAVTSEGSEAIVNINGTGQFNLTSKEESIIPNLNINESSTFNLVSNISLQITEKLKIEKDARFNIGNNKEDIIYVKNYIQEGTLSFDIFTDTTDTKYCKSDRIITDGKVFLDSASKLEIFTNGIPMNDRIERKYVLITYASLKGKFNKKNVIFIDTDLMEEDINYAIEYKDNRIVFILNPKETRKLLSAVI